MTWSRLRFDAVPVAIDPDDEPTVRIPRERGEDLVRPATRTADELEAELAQHAGAGQ